MEKLGWITSVEKFFFSRSARGGSAAFDGGGEGFGQEEALQGVIQAAAILHDVSASFVQGVSAPMFLFEFRDFRVDVLFRFSGR